MSSLLVCSLSGNPLIHPVISLKTGHLYQKSTMIKHIQCFHTCPHTNQPLQVVDLLDVVGNPQLPISTFSIPQAMAKLEKQYNNIVQQAHYLKTLLRQKRQELAVSVYRQQAAIRVIAKLKKERDQTRLKMAQLISQNQQ